MSLTKKELLYQIAEESAYSFKGHMKTADGYGFTLSCLIVVPLVTSLAVLVWEPAAWIERTVSALGFLFSTLALMSSLAMNKEKADQTIAEHMNLGNDYLALYNEIKLAATDIESVTQNKLEGFQKRINELNSRTGSHRITFVGSCWSALRIRKEMDLAWLYR